MKVLQLYYKMPFPPHDGGAYSIYSASLSLLSQGIDLRIFSMDQQKAPGKKELIPETFMKQTRLESVYVDNRIKIPDALKSLLSGSSYLADRFYSPLFLYRLLELLMQETYDIIQLEHLYLCHYIEEIRKVSHAKIVLRAQNVEHRVWKNFSLHVKNPLLRKYMEIETKKLEVFESKMAGKADGIIALTETDADYFRAIKESGTVAAIPPGVEFPFLPVDTCGNPDRFIPIVYHLGSMDWKPNIQGLKWFVRKVFPLIIEKDPGIRICIAGKNMPGYFFRKGGNQLFVEGEIEDSVKYQENRTIMIVPLLSGSGIRIKILEGMALGKTIISTSQGAEGIRVKHNESILIADTAEEFAEQVCRCAQSETLCREIGKRARKVAEQYYSIESVGELMKKFYQSFPAGNNSM